MKKLKVDKSSVPDRESVYIRDHKYEIYLGNSSKNSFTSDKKAKKYLAETNRFLNLTLQELNLVYIDVFVEYRRLWTVVPNEIYFENDFGRTAKIFSNSIRYANTTNNNAFSFINMNKICNELKSISNNLADICVKQKNYLLVNYMRTIITRIDRIEKDIDNYGKTQQV